MLFWQAGSRQAVQRIWNHNGGPIYEIIEALPEVKKVLSDVPGIKTWQEAGEDGSLDTLPACTGPQLYELVTKMWKKMLESMARHKNLQHKGTAKFHPTTYKVPSEELAPFAESPRKRRRQSKRQALKISDQGVLLLISIEHEQAWEEAVGDDYKEKRVGRAEQCLCKDDALSIWFDDLVDLDVAMEIAAKAGGDDYELPQIQLAKLRRQMVDNSIGHLQLGYREYGDDRQLHLITEDQHLVEALELQQQSHPAGAWDDYMLLVGRDLLAAAE